jgi:hypothetical protein
MKQGIEEHSSNPLPEPVPVPQQTKNSLLANVKRHTLSALADADLTTSMPARECTAKPTIPLRISHWICFDVCQILGSSVLNSESFKCSTA